MSGKDLVLGLLLGLMIGVGGWGIIQFGFANEEELPPCTGEQCTVPYPPSNLASPTTHSSPTKLTSRATTEWPPIVGEVYPDLELIDEYGQKVRLSSFKGSVLVMEPIGMTCAACQAYSGGHQFGSFGGVVPQKGLPSIEKFFPDFTNGLALSDHRIVFIQVLLFNMSMGAPTGEDVRSWSDHFKMERSDNYVVLGGTKRLLGPASNKMIPGFQLVDQDFILRADSTGHSPRDNLYTTLLPMVHELL